MALPFFNMLIIVRKSKCFLGILHFVVYTFSTLTAIDFQIINFTRPEGERRISYTSTTDNAVKLII